MNAPLEGIRMSPVGGGSEGRPKSRAYVAMEFGSHPFILEKPSSISATLIQRKRWQTSTTCSLLSESIKISDCWPKICSHMLHNSLVQKLNMVMITVGRLKNENLNVIDSWIEQVRGTGGFGEHHAEMSAAAISHTFDLVAQCLNAEVGGATEC